MICVLLRGYFFPGEKCGLVAAVNFAWPSYGRALLDFCSSIYPGYHVSQMLGSVVCGSSYALFNGAVGGALFAWLYNRFAV